MLLLGCGCCGIDVVLTRGGPGGMDTNTPKNKRESLITLTVYGNKPVCGTGTGGGCKLISMGCVR